MAEEVRKEMFIRALWGETGYKNINKTLARRDKVGNDVNMVKWNDNAPDFKTYVYGEDNYKFLVDQGFDCRLVSKKPILYSKEGNGAHYYTHKLTVLREAMKEFDDIVFLDWDTVAGIPVPKDFWDVLRAKGSIQAILRGYKQTKCPWRKADRRQRPCASFIYVGDQQISKDLVQIWKKKRHLSEEQIIALYTDDVVGGWQGRDVYWEKFEPDFFALCKGEVPFQSFSTERLRSKNLAFIHLNKKQSGKVLKGVAALPEDERSKIVTSRIATALKTQVFDADEKYKGINNG
jgi:hypothetical protein